MEKMNYADSGVNIKEGENAVNSIKEKVKQTFNKNVLNELGSFGGLYALDLNEWKNPCLVSSMDGVGTKLIVAQKARIFNSVGQDLINHCVNDILVQGAIPQYFLDYIGVGTLKSEQISQIIDGLTIACNENEMALIGGEMAEMPGIYSPDDFDLVGTIVGLVEKDSIITGEAIEAGDLIIGLASTGLHTNGYSLARKIVFEKMGLNVEDKFPNTEKSVGDILLSIHKSYLKIMKNWLDPAKNHGMAHITGGGIPGNLKRILPNNLSAEIDCNSWEVPNLFKVLQENGNITNEEMFSAFNMGIGFIAVMGKSDAEEFIKETNGFLIGKIVESNSTEKVRLNFD